MVPGRVRPFPSAEHKRPSVFLVVATSTLQPALSLSLLPDAEATGVSCDYFQGGSSIRDSRGSSSYLKVSWTPRRIRDTSLEPAPLFATSALISKPFSLPVLTWLSARSFSAMPRLINWRARWPAPSESPLFFRSPCHVVQSQSLRQIIATCHLVSCVISVQNR